MYEETIAELHDDLAALNERNHELLAEIERERAMRGDARLREVIEGQACSMRALADERDGARVAADRCNELLAQSETERDAALARAERAEAEIAKLRSTLGTVQAFVSSAARQALFDKDKEIALLTARLKQEDEARLQRARVFVREMLEKTFRQQTTDEQVEEVARKMIVERDAEKLDE